MDTISESALKVDSGRKALLSYRGIEPALVACQSDALPTLATSPSRIKCCILGSAALNPQAISTLLPVTCAMLLQSTLQLSPPSQLAQSKMDVTPSDAGKHKADKSAQSKLMVRSFDEKMVG